MASVELTRGTGWCIQDNSLYQNTGADGDDWVWYIGTWSSRGTAEDAVYGAGCVGYAVPQISGILDGKVTIPCTFQQNWNVSGEVNAVLSMDAPADTSWRFGPASMISDVQTFTYTATALEFTLTDQNIGGKNIYLYLYPTKGVDFGIITKSFSAGALEYTQGGMVYIGGEAYQAYIEDGEAWHPYMPNVADGAAWVN